MKEANIISDDEQQIRTIRQTPWQLIVATIPGVILVILPFFFLFPLFNWGTIGIIIFTISLAVGLFSITRNFIVWYFSTLTVTNQRIIDVDQQKLFQRIVSDIELIKIQDVFYQIKGLGQTISRVGNIHIVLDDNKTKIEIKNINKPQRIQQLILQLKADTIHDKLELTKLSAQELVKLVNKIKAGIGEEKFKKILGEEDQPE